MTTPSRFTSADLEAFPENDGKRYEIIDGELYVSRQPHFYHQRVCTWILTKLEQWSRQLGDGQAVIAPGLIFADDDDVAPDVVWASTRRMDAILNADGKLHAAPELIAEVLSPGTSNRKRDREAKLKLYSRRAVEEYWIADWKTHRVDVFRRQGDLLVLTSALAGNDALSTPLFPGVSCPVSDLFEGIP